MDTLINAIGRAANGGVAIYIIVEIVIFMIGIWILYAVIKGAIKNALLESREEINYIIRKALLESKTDIESGEKKILDYRHQQL